MRTLRCAWLLLPLTVACKDGGAGAPAGGDGGAGETSLFSAQLAPPSARSFRFADDDGPKSSDKPDVPMSLTASDGTGLSLVALDAHAVVRDPVAFTELHLTFSNPEARTLEGQFRITLPAGAKLSRFAMKVGDRLQEGEVVEKQAARRAYEDFLHRKQDPALLEQAAGNEFSARVFPIPAHGTKELILSYSQELPTTKESYRLPLRGLPNVGKLDVDVRTDFGAPFELHRTDFVPDLDVLVPVGDGRKQGRKEGELAVLRVPLGAPELAKDAPVDEIESLAILVDSSASRALGWAEQVRLVSSLVDGLRAGAGGDVPLTVIAFDQRSTTLFEGKVGGFDDAAKKKLADVQPLGASNLHGALGALQAQNTRYARVIIVGDGISTAGPDDGAHLAGAAKELASKGVQRIDAIAMGGLRDDAALGRVVDSGLARAGVVIDGAQTSKQIADRLVRRTLGDAEVAIDGAEWSWPRTTRGHQLGDEMLVFARLKKEAVDQPFSVRFQGKAYAVPASAFGPAPRQLLDRAVAAAEIQSLVDARELVLPEQKDERKKLDDRIVSLSTHSRVLSPLTALLVLETEADYARFHLERNALADILRVDNGEIAVVSRSFATPVKAKAQPDVPAPADVSRNRDGVHAEANAAPGAPPPAPATPSPAPAAKAAMDKDESAEAEKKSDRADDGKLSEAPPPAARAAGPSAAPPPHESSAWADPLADSLGRSERRRGPSALSGSSSFDNEGDYEPRVNPYTGKFATIMGQLAKKQNAPALDAAWSWRKDSPADVLALVVLGEALEKNGDAVNAARAYGSLIDLFPARADMRRFAGERLDRLAAAAAQVLELSVDTYAKAAAQRPDHPASHRLLAYALVKQKKFDDAFAAMELGLKQRYPEGRFAGVVRILKEDLGLIAAAWIAEEPAKKAEIEKRLAAAGGTPERGASLRFVLNWETDANDVDFHIHDGKGGHAYYASPNLPSGGELYADVTTGYGPECFTIRNGAYAGPYRLEAHYYSRGPMGYGMGKLEVIRHDGKGHLAFEERPFVIMQDNAFVEMGTIKRE